MNSGIDEYAVSLSVSKSLSLRHFHCVKETITFVPDIMTLSKEDDPYISLFLFLFHRVIRQIIS